MRDKVIICNILGGELGIGNWALGIGHWGRNLLNNSPSSPSSPVPPASSECPKN